MRRFPTIVAFLLCLLTQQAVHAEDYPNRPVRVIVPYSAGGSGDLLARFVGVKLSAMWGQPVVVDNRAGANGLVGTESAAHAASDGYTLYLGNDGPLTISASLYAKVPYDWRTDFAPISMVGQVHQVLVINPQHLQVDTVADLVALARAKPGALNYASIGIGSPPHLGAEKFRLATKTDIVHVPYRGTPLATTGLLGGEVSMFFVGSSAVSPMIMSGALRALAVTAKHRLDDLKDVPTFTEVGYPDVDVSIWFAMFAPSGTPTNIVAKISKDIATVLDDADSRAALTSRGFDISATSPEQLKDFVENDYKKWNAVIKKLGLSLE